MTASRDRSADKVEFPRGDIEIIAPGEDRRRRRGVFDFEGASAQRTYTFRTGASGFLGFVFAAMIACGLFVFVAGFFAVVMALAVATVSGFALRGKLRQLLGR